LPGDLPPLYQSGRRRFRQALIAKGDDMAKTTLPGAQKLNGWLRKVPAWPIYLIAVLPPAWYLYQGLTGGLGVDPVKAMEHALGLLALQVLVATLLVTPLRTYTGLNLIKYRRALGLVGFFYVVLHLTVWWVLDVQLLSEVWKDIVKRPYITIGMGAFLLLIPLAITSNNRSIRKVGPLVWKRIHMLAYPAILLGAVHFVWLRKGFQLEPLLYLAGIILLLVIRIEWKRRRAVA